MLSSGVVSANSYVALRTPSDLSIVVQVQPNTTIYLGRYGSFNANSIIGRPFYFTYEILDKKNTSKSTQPDLRIVSAKELYADIEDDEPLTSELDGEPKFHRVKEEGGLEYDVVGEDGQLIMRTNRQIVDNPNTQMMTMEEIEKLKAEGVSGKELIQKILDSHLALDQKTAFALAKYTLRKTKKYIKQFTVLPLDVSTLAQWTFENKDAMKILEIREEILSLLGSWSNIHFTPLQDLGVSSPDEGPRQSGRWLVLDEAAGLIVAYMAEKMGILHEQSLPKDEDLRAEQPEAGQDEPSNVNGDAHKLEEMVGAPKSSQQDRKLHKRVPLTDTNTIHLIHAASQPNLSLLKYFHFDLNNPSPSHPLTPSLKTLSWLQLLRPAEDTGYAKPEEFSEDVIRSWKSARRSNYYKKWRRWERVKSTVDETRAGGFDGLIVASVMHPVSVLRVLVPLLRGGAQIVVYNRFLEPLAELADFYSSSRRTAFINNPPDPMDMPTEDFPVDPTLLLAASVQTARLRQWQALPGRTHPLMTGKGGTDGFVFTATRVLPAEGKVTARGKSKRRKTTKGEETLKEPQYVLSGEEEDSET